MRKILLIVASLAVASLLLAGCDLETITGNAVSPYKCTDSDGGRNSDIKGTVKNELGSFTDNCKDDRYVLENYCKGNVVRKETVPCRYGCQEGRCLSYFDTY